MPSSTSHRRAEPAAGWCVERRARRRSPPPLKPPGTPSRTPRRSPRSRLRSVPLRRQDLGQQLRSPRLPGAATVRFPGFGPWAPGWAVYRCLRRFRRSAEGRRHVLDEHVHRHSLVAARILTHTAPVAGRDDDQVQLGDDDHNTARRSPRRSRRARGPRARPTRDARRRFRVASPR